VHAPVGFPAFPPLLRRCLARSFPTCPYLNNVERIRHHQAGARRHKARGHRLPDLGLPRFLPVLGQALSHAKNVVVDPRLQKEHGGLLDSVSVDGGRDPRP